MTASCTGAICSLTDSIQVVSGAMLQSVGAMTADTTLMAPWLLPLAAGMVGAILASFSGVVADRMPRIQGWNETPAEQGISLSHPPSHCDSCKRRLSALDLVPVAGWLINRGRCQHCGASVPWIYPVMEAASFVASAAIVAVLGPTWVALAACICLWALLAISWLDWTSHEIPDAFTVPLGALGLLASPFEMDAWTRGLGAIVCALFVWLAFVMTGRAKRVDAMSYGDVALSAAAGAWLGACGAIPFLGASALAYLAYAMPLRARGVVWVPMGPALAIAFMVVALLGIRI